MGLSPHEMKQALSISLLIIVVLTVFFVNLTGCAKRETHHEAVRSLISAVNQHDHEMVEQLVPSTSLVSDAVQCVIDNAELITLLNLQPAKFPVMISRVLQEHERYYKIVIRVTLRTNPNCGSGQHIWFILVAQKADESFTITSIYKQP